MTAEDAFLIDILANPDEPAARLVYADWLEDQGDARTEWIRRGCEVVKSPLGSQERRKEREAFRVSLYRQGCSLPEVDGLVLSWDNVVSVFRYRLAEAVTWCSGRGLPLRSAELHPGPSFSGFAAGRDGFGALSSDAPDWGEAVQRVTVRRGQELARLGQTPRWLAEDPAGGRLLVYLPGAAPPRRERATRRRRRGRAEEAPPAPALEYLDERRIPGWDSWLAHGRESPPDVPHARGEDYLLAWVPPHLVGDVQRRMDAEPERRCFLWAEDLDRPFLHRLRDAGLIG
jgi:uncharacterized protein (TIGR02996 family)